MSAYINLTRPLEGALSPEAESPRAWFSIVYAVHITD
jgi:hypothetical protein